ncbi:MAG: transporter [Nevskia sp.]
MIAGGFLPGLASANADPDTGRFTFKTSAFYTTGDYGRPSSTDIFYLPTTAKYASGRWSIDLTVPYISVTGPGNVIPDIGVSGGTATARRTQSGLGDVRLGGSYRAYYDPAEKLAIDLVAKVKFGTAERAKGLGTGENDYSIQLGVQKAWGRILAGGSVGYRFQGSPPGLKLRDVVYGEADLAYRFSPVNSVGIGALVSEASTAKSSDRLLATAYYKHAFTKNWSTQLYGLKGFSSSSPDYGGGLSVAYAFQN